MDAIWGDLVAEKLNPGGTEGALVGMDDEAVVLEALEDLAYVAVVLLCTLGKDEDVHVADVEWEVAQGVVNHPLEGCLRVNKSEGGIIEDVGTKGHADDSFEHFTRMDKNLEIPL